MNHSFENKGHPYFNIFVHVSHSNSTTGGFCAVIVHPNANHLASSYGIQEDNPPTKLMAYLVTTFPFEIFGIEAARPGQHLKLTLEEYNSFLQFLFTLWPMACDQLLAQKYKSTSTNDFHLVSNLWGYGMVETTFNCHIAPNVWFQAWNNVMFDKVTQKTEMLYSARLKKGMDILWIDFQVLSEITKDDSVEQYLIKVFKPLTPKSKASFQQ